MPQAARSARKLRLLVVVPWDGHPPVDVARFATCPELELVGVAKDCDDGLRLSLMTYPDLVVLTWSAEAPKLLRALEHLRDHHHSLQTLVVADSSAPPVDFTLPDGVRTIEVEALKPEGLADTLRAALASAARYQED